MTLAAAAEGIAEAIEDFIYPHLCSTCSGSLSRHERYVCSRCWDSFDRVVPTETIIQAIESKFLVDEAVDLVDSVFLFEQDPRVRMAVHLLKYDGAEAIADKFGVYISKKIAGDERLSTCSVIAPVPLHPVRQRERGYNQSDLIARSVGRNLEIDNLPNLLIRTRQTQSQTLFDAEGRSRNIHGAFAIGPEFHKRICGVRVLLIDDVITTGSTIKECASTLRQGGASGVCAASAAITV